MADDVTKNGSVTVPIASGSASQPDSKKRADAFFTDDPEDPMNDTKRELQGRFELLPEEIKKIILDSTYEQNLFEIAKNRRLTYDELETLDTETTMVLLGMTRPEEYRDELQEELKKNDPEIDVIVQDVNAKVFAPIRTALEKMYAAVKEPIDYLKEPGEEAAGTETPQTAPPVTASASTASPTPARSTAFAPIPTLSTQEKSVLEKTGVVISETPSAVRPETSVMPDRSDVLKGIENPPRTPPAGMLADKFSGTSTMVNSTRTTDYTVPKSVNAPAPISPARTPNVDPYREPIE